AEIERALFLPLQPEYLPAPLHWDEYLFGRVPVERRASASLGTHIGHREARGAFLHVRLECRILSDAHAYHIDDVALVARNALVEERHVQRPNVFHACDTLALHRLLRDSRDGLPSDTWIGNRHGLLPYGQITPNSARCPRKAFTKPVRWR